MKRIFLSLAVFLLFVFVGAFWLAFLSERPPLTTDPATLAGDGSTLDYCTQRVLDGSGKNAADIPKGNTPGCSYAHFPLPILAECTEPLADGADDIRGLWRAVSGRYIEHIERIEQCGGRTVITTSGIIHDYGPNATGGLNTNDTEGQVVFTIGEREYCPRTSASMIWEDNVLNFYVFGWGPKPSTGTATATSLYGNMPMAARPAWSAFARFPTRTKPQNPEARAFRCLSEARFE